MKAVVIMLGLVLFAGTALAASPAETAAGKKIAFSRSLGNCLACHVIAGGEQPGDIGPTLEHVKTLVPDRKTLYAIIYDEEARNPETAMPPFGKNAILTPRQINELIDFLYTK